MFKGTPCGYVTYGQATRRFVAVLPDHTQIEHLSENDLKYCLARRLTNGHWIAMGWYSDVVDANRAAAQDEWKITRKSHAINFTEVRIVPVKPIAAICPDR